MATVKSLGKGVFPSIAKSGVDAGTLKTLGVRGIDTVPDSTGFTLPQVLELHRTSPQLFPWVRLTDPVRPRNASTMPGPDRLRFGFPMTGLRTLADRDCIGIVIVIVDHGSHGPNQTDATRTSSRNGSCAAGTPSSEAAHMELAEPSIGTTFAAAALSIGASNVASASTATTDPTGSTAAHTDAEHATDTTEVTLAVDGSAEPTSPEAEAFCAAELAAEAAVTFEDETVIGAAVEALTAAAEPVGLTDTVGVLLATVEEGGPEFDEAYTDVIGYMKANCGYAELDVVASEYHFDGLPSELPAGPTIITLDNVGEQVHEIYIGRVNDDVTLTVEELAELPEDQLHGPMVTPTAFASTFPGATSYGAADLTSGRYIAMCFLPEGATPEVLIELEQGGVDGPEDSLPAGIEVGPPHYTIGMIHEFNVA